MGYHYERHTGEKTPDTVKLSDNETWRRHTDHQNKESGNAGMGFIAFGSLVGTVIALSSENARDWAPLTAMPLMAFVALALADAKQKVCPHVCGARNTLASLFKTKVNGVEDEADLQKPTLGNRVAAFIECGTRSCVPG